jgi:hypothetical protein
MGKGSGGGQTTSTVTNTNIPEYAQGYVENMLMGTQQQLFNTTTDPTTGETELGSLRPYQAYGGTYDQSGNMTSYDPSKAVAGFTPMQQMAQNGIYNLQMPGEFNAASAYTADAMQRAANAGYDSGQFTMGQAAAPDVTYYQMNQPQNVQGQNAQQTYLENAPTISAAERMRAAQLGATPLSKAQTGTAARLGAAPMSQAERLGAAPMSQAARLSAAPTMQAQTGTAAQLRAAAMMEAAKADFTKLGEVPLYTGHQLNYTPTSIEFERVQALPLERLQMQAAGNVGTQSFTRPGTASEFMSPYMQSVVDIQQREAQRQADIASTKRGAQFAQAGAFGGSRQAIENAEAARNLATQKGDIQAQGSQAAFQAAQGQFNTEQQAALQAALANQAVQQQTGVQNLSALLQTQGLGAQTNLTAQQLNQAAGIDTSKFNQSQLYNTALQNAQLLQQQQLANQSLQGQYGLTQGQMDQAVRLANAGFQQGANINNQSATNQFSLQQGTMGQQMAIANLANRQQAAAANQALAGQYGLQQGTMGQQTALANQALAGQYGLQQGTMGQQTALANQALAGQFGLQQGSMNQQIAAANLANRQQTAMANQALQGQYGLQQGQFNQAEAAANQQAANQIALANQGILGQYGLNQGQLSQANQQFNAQQNQAANLANQQMAYNTGLQNLQADLGVQQLGAGQNMQAQLANQQAMLANQQATEQSRQFGANYGQQMNAQQLAAAQQLGGLGQQQLAAQQGIYGLQNQIGGQQQQLQQQIINQSMQDYANAQQYPLMQLGTMSNMLRGLPMQASTTNMYQAAPNAITQGIGAVGAYGALNNAFGSTTTTGRKEGGVINAAKGGIMSYDVGGEIESTLSDMDVDSLKKYAKESSSPSVKKMAMRLIQEKSMPVPRMARGGILAFAKGDKVDELAAANEQGLASPDGLTALDVDYKAPTISELYANQKPFMDRSKYDAMVERTKDYVYPERPRAPAPTAFQTLTSERPINIPTGASGFPRINAPTPPAAPPPAAPPTPPQGIAQAAAATAPPRPPVARPPAGPAPAPAVPPTPSAAITPPALSPEDPMFATLRAEATKTPETQKEIFERQKKDQEAIGLGPNRDLADYRSRIMAERANLDDEAKRQKNLRLAEFFASWGSTPGATLVAGMTALKKTIPTLIEDEKERKKVLRETDKLIFDLGQAERLELKGSWDKAGEEKTKLAERGMKLNEVLGRHYDARMQTEAQLAGNVLSAQTSRYVADSSAAASGYAARLRLQGDQAHAAASAANSEAARDANNFNKAQTAYQLAQNARLSVDKEYDAVINQKAYMQAKQDVANLSNNETPQIKARVQESRDYIRNVEADFKTRREMMDKSVRIAENRLNSISGGTAIPTTTPTTAAPPGHTFAGYTPDGKPVYKNAQGKTFVGQ